MTATTNEILDLDGPTRVDGFRFDLLDAQHKPIGSLSVAKDSVPTVSCNTGQTTVRTIENLHVPAADLAAIDAVHDRVQPVMVLASGATYPLGVFMFGEDVRAPFSWGVDWTPSLFDESFILDQSLDMSVGAAPGESLLALYFKVIKPFDLPAVIVEVADRPVPDGSPLLFPAGKETPRSVCAAIAPLVGAYPPFFDENGAWHLKPSLSGTPAPDHFYEVGQLSRIIDGSTKTSSSAYKAYNRWITLGGTTDQPMIGVYDLPASSPNSAAARGGLVVTAPAITYQGIGPSATVTQAEAQALLDVAAQAAALSDRNAYATAEFASSANPQHRTYDVVRFRGDLYLETAWRLECVSGGRHAHSLTRLYA